MMDLLKSILKQLKWLNMENLEIQIKVFMEWVGDPMNQAMLLPPQSPAAIQAQAAAMLQMQQYMQGQAPSAQFCWYSSTNSNAISCLLNKLEIVPPSMTSPYFSFGQQQMPASSPFL